MCGRYNLIHDPAIWRLTRPIKVGKTAPFQPRYNITPGQQVPVYRDAGNDLELIDMNWGYIPHFVTDDRPWKAFSKSRSFENQCTSGAA